jgi:hypothetical protein
MITNRLEPAYQYELNKVVDFWDIDSERLWDYNTYPYNFAGSVKLSEIDISKETLVLHFDDNCLGFSHLNPEDREKMAHQFLSLANAPFGRIIFVCHGSPPRQDRFNPESFFQKDLSLDEGTFQEIKKVVGERLVVLPSMQAQKAWGFEKSVVIEPSFELSNFPFSCNKVNRSIIIHPSPPNDPHGSGYHVSALVSLDLPVDLYGVDSLNQFKSVLPDFSASDNSSAMHRWYSGLDIISQYNACLDLQDGTCSALSTLTAMSCGVPVVGNGIWNSDLILHGVTGYSALNLLEVRNYLLFLMKNPEIAVRLGKRARRHVQEKRPFSTFVKKWRSIL